MARPRIYREPRVATAVRLPETLHRRLHDAAADREVSANLLIVRAVSDYLDHLAPLEQVLEPHRKQRSGLASHNQGET